MTSRRKSPIGLLILVITFGVNLSLVYLGVRSLEASRKDAVRLAEVQTRNLAQAMDLGISSTLRRVDQALLTVVAELERGKASGARNRMEMKLLVLDQEKLVPEAVAIRVADAEGRVIINNPTQNPMAHFRDRPFWIPLRDQSEAGLYVSKPIIGIFTGKWVFVAARRYNAPNGQFGGVVVAPIFLDRLQQAIAGFDLGAGGTLTLRDRDGGFMVRNPELVKGQRLAVGSEEISPELHGILASGAQQQTYFAEIPFDKAKRVLTFRRIQGLPMFVVAALAEDDYLAQWRVGRKRILIGLGLALLGFSASGFILRRLWLNREHGNQALAESEEKFRSLAESSTDYIMRYDRHHRHTYMNPAGLKVSGMAASDLIGKTHRESGFPEDLCELWEHRIDLVFRTGMPVDVDFEWIGADGPVFLNLRLTPEFDAEGQVRSVLGVSRDVSAMKRTEALLKKVTAMVPGVVYQYLLRPNGSSCFPYASEGLFDIYEVTPEEVREDATPVFGRIHPEDLEATANAIFGSARTLELFHWEFRVVLPRQGLRWRACDARPERLPDGGTLWHGIIMDITERKTAEEALKRSEERFALAFHASPDAIAITRLSDGVYVLVNEGFSRMLGRSTAEVIGKSSMQLGVWVDPGDRERWAAALRRDGQVDNLEVRFRKSDGSEIACLVSSRSITWEGELVQLSITRDISDLKRIEAQLQESELEYRLLFERSLDAIIFTSPDGQILDANPAACRMFGRSVEEIRALGRNGFIDTEDSRLPAALEARAMTGTWIGELNFLRRDGTTFPCEISSVLFKDKQGRSKAGVIIRDISVRKQAEELRQKLNAELQQSQKLDSLGSLAGGVAHDMNNILGAIQAVNETLKRKHGADPALAASLHLIDRASTRGKVLVNGLTKFARKSLQEPEVLELNLLVKEEIDLLSRTTLQKFRLVMDLDESLSPVSGERGSLASVLMNLCVNALDAMPEGGTLTIRTRNLPGALVELSVEDTGTGMPPEVAARAMDPFFTTKSIGKGTGLGLALAYATAQTHGGTLSIQSEERRGTTVRLCLPMLTEGTRLIEAEEGPIATEGSLRILLVDDDELIRAAVPSMIEALGHTVTTAEGGAEALARLKAGEPVDLVILDLNMPGMNGVETHGHLREVWPDLPILLATGHLDARTSELLRTDPKAASISKPYSLEELAQKLMGLKA
ncbi:MAG: PAS domain S-box protein [Holophagaceae bacterium]|nr:PAS domain S-box protein [Holophagaceae bacterium]